MDLDGIRCRSFEYHWISPITEFSVSLWRILFSSQREFLPFFFFGCFRTAASLRPRSRSSRTCKFLRLLLKLGSSYSATKSRYARNSHKNIFIITSIFIRISLLIERQRVTDCQLHRFPPARNSRRNNPIKYDQVGVLSISRYFTL